jgi:hypothetical protein
MEILPSFGHNIPWWSTETWSGIGALWKKPSHCQFQVLSHCRTTHNTCVFSSKLSSVYSDILHWRSEFQGQKLAMEHLPLSSSGVRHIDIVWSNLFKLIERYLLKREVTGKSMRYELLTSLISFHLAPMMNILIMCMVGVGGASGVGPGWRTCVTSTSNFAQANWLVPACHKRIAQKHLFIRHCEHILRIYLFLQGVADHLSWKLCSKSSIDHAGCDGCGLRRVACVREK